MKKYFQHSVWGDLNEWVESDADTFNDEVIAFRNQFNKRYDFNDNKTIYYFDHKENSFYDWKVEFFYDYLL